MPGGAAGAMRRFKNDPSNATTVLRDDTKDMSAADPLNVRDGMPSPVTVLPAKSPKVVAQRALAALDSEPQPVVVVVVFIAS